MLRLRVHAYARLIATHYERLGLEPDATPQQIKQAYRTLARLLHPDLADGDRDEHAGQMADLNEAFRVLRDPQRRHRYDAQLRGESVSAEPDQGEVDEMDRPSWIVDESPDPVVFTNLPKGVMIGFVVAAMVGLLIATFVVLGGDSPVRIDDPVDGVVSVGSCVAVSGVGGQVLETSCDGPYDGTVTALLGFDQNCPTGTIQFASQSVSTKVCVTPRGPG